MAIYGPRLWLLGVALLLWTPSTYSRSLTNEDITEVMTTLIHMVRLSENKLERHESREKALGDQVKKMLIGLDKKHRALEPLKGMISRLDERLSNVETILLQKEEREKSVQQKTSQALDAIQNKLESITSTITQKQKQPEIDNNLTTNEDSILERRLDTTDAKLDSVKVEIEQLKKSFSKDSLHSICMEINYNVKPFEKHITEAENLLSRYDLKLEEHNNKGECKAQTDLKLNEVVLADEAWHNKMSEIMERQEKEIVEIRKVLSSAESMWKEIPKLSDLYRFSNETVHTIVTGIDNVKENDEKSVNQITTKLREMGDRLVATNEDIQRSLTQGNTLTERTYTNITQSYDVLRTEIQTLSKNERIMLQTADNVIANKKYIELGINKIVMDVTELIKLQHKNMDQTVSKRLDDIETSILNNQSGSYGNLTTKIENEISQVWGQIGVMHQQLISTKDTLDKLSEQTVQYVNSSTVTINKVKDEVSNITTHILVMGDNMNYVLGRLSIVTQEFTQISTGISDVLINLQADLRNVKAKIDVTGPGPHNITSPDKAT